ncbi:hypothetical protein Tco_1476457 [Tanacetum coccineum]
MSDSKDSTVTYTEAPPSPDYVPGLEEPEQAPPSPVYVPYVPEPVYLEFMPPEDEEDPEEDDDEDPEEDPTDYPADGGDDGDDEDESFDDDEDDDLDIKGDEEEEEHPTPADSTAAALPAADYAPSAEETEPFETDKFAATPPPHPANRVTARISIQDEPPTPFWSDTEVAKLLAIPTPLPSPLSPWLSPLPQIPSPPLLVSPPLPLTPPPLPVSPTYPLGYRVAMIRLRVEAPSTSHSPLPHVILSHTRADTPPSADRLEVCLPPRKRLCIDLGPRYEVRESSSAVAAKPTRGFMADYGFVCTIDREIMRDLERDVGYGITDTWDEMLVDMLGAPTTDDTELGRRMTEFATRVRDRRAHARTTLLIEREARMSREAWGRSMYASDLARSEVMSLRTIVLGQQAVITELQAADRRRHAAIIELLATDRRRQAQFIEALKLLKALKTQMTEFQRQ